jgi:hypothetical protein
MENNLKKYTMIVTLFAFVSTASAPSILTAQQQALGEITVLDNVENIVAVDNVCAWPNLTLLPDGTIIATIYNKPSHGLEEGEADCYASADGGRTWTYTGTPIEHEPGETRMNLAAGLSNDGSLVVIISGWGGKGFREYIVPNSVCRSKDGGKTWETKGSVDLPEGEPDLIPFGDIVRLGGKTLAAPAYGTQGGSKPAYILYSYDDGYTWGGAVPIGEVWNRAGALNNFNESTVLRINTDRWLAAVRTDGGGQDLQLLVSEDEGGTWNIPEQLSSGGISRRMEHPAHLLELADGRILLTYGIRWGVHGVGARVSSDKGETWSAPKVLYYYGGGDGGYPSSVQLDDSTIVTAYYCDANKNHPRYHMGAIRWKLP